MEKSSNDSGRELDLEDLESRIEELNVRIRELITGPSSAPQGDAETNGCTYGCTHACTNGCTGRSCLLDLTRDHYDQQTNGG
jgi:hypothetical protein